MSNQQVLNDDITRLFGIYQTFSEACRKEGVQAVLDDMRHYYTETYELMEAEFKRRQRAKELGVLLVNSM